jgi:hypothetical protein
MSAERESQRASRKLLAAALTTEAQKVKTPSDMSCVMVHVYHTQSNLRSNVEDTYGPRPLSVPGFPCPLHLCHGPHRPAAPPPIISELR